MNELMANLTIVGATLLLSLILWLLFFRPPPNKPLVAC